MRKLNQHMKDIIAHNTLGFAATVCADGTPNLSPKGTCLVLDDEHIIFGEIRSPTTVANLSSCETMEMNFFDLFSRQAVRVKGSASYVARGTPEFDILIEKFAQWGELTSRMNGVVKLQVDRALAVKSPAYDLGATEAELRQTWRNHFLEH